MIIGAASLETKIQNKEDKGEEGGIEVDKKITFNYTKSNVNGTYVGKDV